MQQFSFFKETPIASFLGLSFLRKQESMFFTTWSPFLLARE
jgi:hypothetical protein